ncbi:MAG: sugar phosphate isomerase/epimerase [Clostridia bacterium]|nr:sugar phosphate isomerase/epimerase [Clostridia bacterium]
MYKQKLCLGLFGQDKMSQIDQVKLFRNVGFEGFFADYSSDNVALRRIADETGMIFQSIHAAFTKMDAMWEKDSRSQAALDELLDCARICADVNVPIMVVHAFIGFEKHTPTQMGIDTFGQLVNEAARLGVKVAFENTEGEEYLYALLEAFRDEKHVGFCWDSGHEMCYNRSQDLLAKFGDRLIATHINDNLGIKDNDGVITWIDDLHLLPFDGIGDWKNAAERLDRCNFNEMLTFELTYKSKPGRHENDVYDRMDFSDYITEAYKRACKVASLRKHD